MAESAEENPSFGSSRKRSCHRPCSDDLTRVNEPIRAPAARLSHSPCYRVNRCEGDSALDTLILQIVPVTDMSPSSHWSRVGVSGEVGGRGGGGGTS